MTDEQKEAVVRAAEKHGMWDPQLNWTPEKLVQDARAAIQIGMKSQAIKDVLEAAGETIEWEPRF